MTDLNQPTDPNSNATETAPAFTAEMIEKTYFDPDQFDKANELIAKIATITPALKIESNYKDTPADGFGILVTPVSKRVEAVINPTTKEVVTAAHNEIHSIAIFQVPTLDTTFNYGATEDEEGNPVLGSGAEFVRNAVLNAFQAKIAAAVRPRNDGGVAGSVPSTLSDFIETSRSSELKTFNELAKTVIVPALKPKIRTLTVPILRQCLSSTEYATQTYPKASQEFWQLILKNMIALAVKKNMDPSIMISWSETRDQQKADEVSFDLSQLDGLFEEKPAEPAAA